MNVGDKVLVYERSISGRLQWLHEDGVIKKITTTGQLTVEAGVWPGNQAPRILRFKPVTWGGGYTQIGANSHLDTTHIVVGESQISEKRDQLVRENAIREGANRIREIKHKIENLTHYKLSELDALVDELKKAITAARLVESLKT